MSTPGQWLMVKRLVAFAVSLLLVFVIVALVGGLAIGALTPQVMVTSADREISMSQSAVWEKLMDFTAYPKWRSQVAKVDKLTGSSALLAWTEFAPDDSVSHWEFVAAKPPIFVVLNRITAVPSEDEKWIFSLSPSGDKTLLHIEIRETLPSPLRRTQIRLRNWLRNPAQKYLEEVKGSR